MGITAGPPHFVWPTDIGVPFTEFREIVSTMDEWSLKSIGQVAVGTLREDKESSRLRKQRLSDSDIEDLCSALEHEVYEGRCILLQDSEGRVERIVAVSAMVLSRQDGRFPVHL